MHKLDVAETLTARQFYLRSDKMELRKSSWVFAQRVTNTVANKRILFHYCLINAILHFLRTFL